VQRYLVDIPPFSFWVHESGSGTPVILIHGLGGSSDWWRHNVATLAREFRVIALDLIGFGRNRFFLRRSRLPLRFSEVASLLARWIESSIREPVHLVGNSMGGQVAIHVAASRPDLVRSLTLVNSSGIPFEIAPGQHLANLVVPRGAMSFATVLARDVFRAGPTAIAVAFSRLLRDDARPLLQKLGMPVLLLWGERDPLVPLVYAKQMHAMIPNSRLQVIPRAGHIPMWENPGAFNEALWRSWNQWTREVRNCPFDTSRGQSRVSRTVLRTAKLPALATSSWFTASACRARTSTDSRGRSSIAAGHRSPPIFPGLARVATRRRPARASTPRFSHRGLTRSRFATRSGSGTRWAATLSRTSPPRVPISSAKSSASDLCGAAGVRRDFWPHF
jgi:pimeloyl-ACP methyl ester carboxylesterase